MSRDYAGREQKPPVALPSESAGRAERWYRAHWLDRNTDALRLWLEVEWARANGNFDLKKAMERLGI